MFAERERGGSRGEREGQGSRRPDGDGKKIGEGGLLTRSGMRFTRVLQRSRGSSQLFYKGLAASVEGRDMCSSCCV